MPTSIPPTKEHLREVLLFCFNWEKSAAETHRILMEVYGEHVPDERTCQRWFKRFKNGDFNTEDRERSGQPKKFENEKLEALLNENPHQTLKELADALNVTQMAVSKRLKAMGLVQKQGNWMSHEDVAKNST